MVFLQAAFLLRYILWPSFPFYSSLFFSVIYCIKNLEKISWKQNNIQSQFTAINNYFLLHFWNGNCFIPVANFLWNWGFGYHVFIGNSYFNCLLDRKLLHININFFKTENDFHPITFLAFHNLQHTHSLLKKFYAVLNSPLGDGGLPYHLSTLPPFPPSQPNQQIPQPLLKYLHQLPQRRNIAKI